MNGRPVRPGRLIEYFGRKALVSAVLAFNGKGLEAQLRSLPKVTGPAIVAGSAPNPTKPAGVDASWFRVSINASQAVLESFGLPDPDLTIFQPKIKWEDNARLSYWNYLCSKGTGHLIFCVNRKNDGRIEDFLKSKNYNAGAITYMKDLQKNAIVKSVTGHCAMTPFRGDKSVSNGMFGAILALKLGANLVVMSGFSWQKGWFHDKAAQTSRNHQLTDWLACRQIVERRLPVFTTEPEFASRSGLGLWKG